MTRTLSTALVTLVLSAGLGAVVVLFDECTGVQYVSLGTLFGGAPLPLFVIDLCA